MLRIKVSIDLTWGERETSKNGYSNVAEILPTDTLFPHHSVFHYIMKRKSERRHVLFQTVQKHLTLSHAYFGVRNLLVISKTRWIRIV